MPSAKRRAATPPDAAEAGRVQPVSLRKHSFPPIADARTRVLILGSLPGERSLQRREYYAHPQNQFWRLAGAVVDIDLAGLPYSQRLATLADAGVGLWDVIASANRTGSLDSRIQDAAANDLDGLTRTLPQLRAVAFNGGKAAATGRKALKRVEGVSLVTLPSSSPAYTRGFAKKREAWMALRAWLL